ncbi:MAG: DNA/RNA nuclease SfsA [Armatimonadota bacterium]|nr:DNA/RNA nuclease SfsA [Armatimonadota bacterium]MDR7537240.1 DNA/RNA nuclease SfsA [Armatimonadota bacterium]
MSVRLPSPLVPVTVLDRVNRFAVHARAGRRRLVLHLPNPGRMAELLVRGAHGLAALTPSRSRRTAGTLLVVRHRGRWVGMDARLPNRLFEEALRTGALAPFRGYRRWRREAPLGGSRIDFVLEGPSGRCLVETKSCNRVDGGVALFPDAPTTRGAAHLRLLARAARAGRRAAVVWFIQRDDARILRPFAELDPQFARAARQAKRRGVEFYAYTCRVTPWAITVDRAIRVAVCEARFQKSARRPIAQAPGGAYKET